MSEITIPFNRPTLIGQEQVYIAQALATDKPHLAGDGPFTRRCNALLERELGVSKALLTTNCTHALEMTALLLDLKVGDEVILPSFTFVSTANAYALRGAVPVFADVRPDTLNIDETKLESLITPRTRCIVVVHYAGVACEMDEITRIAKKYNLAVIEDNAHGLFGMYKNQKLGTIGSLGTLSFHETKNFTCGEGGALLINQPNLVERAEIIREKGTNRSRFFRGQVDKYSWVELGSSYLPSDLLAAFLYAQLEARVQITQERQRVFEYYQTHLADWAKANNVQLPSVPSYCQQPYHLFYMLLGSLEERQSFIVYMRECGIQTVFHYLPLHLSQMGRQWGYQAGRCPVTERISDCLVRLPFYNALQTHELEKIVEAVQAFKFKAVAGR